MSEAHDDGDLYARGRYRLAYDRRADGSLRSPNFQIVWYDQAAGRNRSKSTATQDIGEAESKLDALYLLRERGQAVCPTCGQVQSKGQRHLLTDAIADYLVARASRPSYGSIKPRLAHVSAYLDETQRLDTACEDVSEEWIEDFREWAIEVPIVSPTGITRERSAGTVEASVRQLAAVINYAHGRKDTLFPAAFSAKQPKEVSRTPTYRADIRTLAAMFRYCLHPKVGEGTKPMPAKWHRKLRAPLFRFLQISVATIARPDAAHDVSTDQKRGQWHGNARVLDLNYKGRAQTKKYRPTIPVARQMALLLDDATGLYVGVESVRGGFDAMLAELKLPRDGETGLKLIRRSVAKLMRDRMARSDWIDLEMMLGHRRFAQTSDLYAPFDPGYLAAAKAAIESIIDDIEKLSPGAFHRDNTGAVLLKGGLSA